MCPVLLVGWCPREFSAASQSSRDQFKRGVFSFERLWRSIPGRRSSAGKRRRGGRQPIRALVSSPESSSCVRRSRWRSHFVLVARSERTCLRHAPNFGSSNVDPAICELQLQSLYTAGKNLKSTSSFCSVFLL